MRFCPSEIPRVTVSAVAEATAAAVPPPSGCCRTALSTLKPSRCRYLADIFLTSVVYAWRPITVDFDSSASKLTTLTSAQLQIALREAFVHEEAFSSYHHIIISPSF